MTTPLTLRLVKGSALTNLEMDTNFTALRTTVDATVAQATLAASNAIVAAAAAASSVFKTGDTMTGLLHMSKPASIQFDGTRTWSGSQAAVGNAELYSFTNQSGATNTGNPVAYHYLAVASDTVVRTGGGAVNVLRVDNTTGAGIKGGRVNIQTNLNIHGAPNDTNGQYVGGAFAVQASAAAPSTQGTIYGTNPTAGLVSGATGNWFVVGEEIDVQAATGTTPQMITGLSVVLVNGHAVAGALGLDSGIVLGNQPGVAGGWDYGIRFNGPGSPAPFKTTSTLIGAYNAPSGLTVANGLDWTNFIFTGNAIMTTGFAVDGVGNTSVNRLKMPLTTPASSSATGVTGTVLVDTNFLYVCTATNTWKRTALSTF